MTTEFSFELSHTGQNSTRLVHKVLYVLVSRGTSYNLGRYPSGYIVTPTMDSSRESISYTEPDQGEERVERLAEIVEEYGEFDVDSTILTVKLVDVADDPIHYSLSVLPGGESGLKFKLTTHSREAGSAEEFLRLVSHVETLCERFEIEYAGYHTEYEAIGSYPWDDGITPESLRRVTYYGAEFVDAFGREHLLSMPAYDVTEHDDGGVFVVIHPEPTGNGEDLDRAREHLSG